MWTIRTVTSVSLLLVHVCGTVCCRTYDETLATDDLSENWKHFCSDINWPPSIVTCLLFCMHFSQILSYLFNRNINTAAVSIRVCCSAGMQWGGQYASMWWSGWPIVWVHGCVPTLVTLGFHWKRQLQVCSASMYWQFLQPKCSALGWLLL